MKQGMSLLSKLLLGNGIILIVLIIIMMVVIQDDSDDADVIEDLAREALSSQQLRANVEALYEEATEMPYLSSHPEELNLVELELGEVSFSNPDKVYDQGEGLKYVFNVVSYMNPKVDEEKHLFGVEQYTTTMDEQGNVVESMTGQQVDISNYLTEKGLPLTITNEFAETELPGPGRYVIEIRVIDKISEQEEVVTEQFTIR